MKTHLLWLPLLVILSAACAKTTYYSNIEGIWGRYLGSDQPNLFKYHDKHPKSGRYFRLEHRF